MAVLNFSAFEPDVRSEAFAAMEPSDILHAGWVPPEMRDNVQNTAHITTMTAMPSLIIYGKGANDDATKASLWDCWKVRPEGWTGTHQMSGCCVGAGGGNMLFSLAAADIAKRKEPERIEVPFWLLPYGISRMLAGMNDRGEGSLGSTFARAVKEYGHLQADEVGLPGFSTEDGYIWGKEAELDWSQGRKIAKKWLDFAKPRLVRTVAKARSTDDVRDGIKNYFGVTCASNWGGMMAPPVKGSGDKARLINRRATTWNHQMSVQGWEDHPDFGELFYILNQWGLSAHGRCPSGAPLGGFWITKKDMEDIVSQGETFVFSQFDGFPALVEPLDFSAF